MNSGILGDGNAQEKSEEMLAYIIGQILGWNILPTEEIFAVTCEREGKITLEKGDLFAIKFGCFECGMFSIVLYKIAKPGNKKLAVQANFGPFGNDGNDHEKLKEELAHIIGQTLGLNIEPVYAR